MSRIIEKLKNAFNLLKNDLWNLKWLILFFAFYWGTVALKLHRFCPTIEVTGFPCPGCGVTRSVLNIFLLHPLMAFHYNPSGFLWVAFFIYCFVWRYFINKKIPALKVLFITFSVIMLGIYIYRMIMFFPSDKPLVFYENSILGRQIPEYNNFILNIIN